MNVALLSLLPLALLGFAAGAFAEAWLRAVAAALPAVAPTWWGALPPLLLAGGAGAWLGGLRGARSARPLVEASLWLAGAAAGALVAPRLLSILVPSFPVAPWRAALAMWLAPLPLALGCGGAAALIAGARAGLRPAAVARLSGVVLPLVTALVALRWQPGRDGAEPDAQLLPAALAAAVAALVTRGLSVFAPDTTFHRPLRDAPARRVQLGLVALQAAAAGGALAAGLLVASREEPSPTVRVALLSGLLAGLVLQFVVRESLAGWLGDASREPTTPSQGAAGRLLLVTLAVVGMLQALGHAGERRIPFAAAALAVAGMVLADLVARGGSGSFAPISRGLGRQVLAVATGAGLVLLAFDAASSRGEPPHAASFLRAVLQVAAAAALLGALLAGSTASGRQLVARFSLVALAGCILAAVSALGDERLVPRVDPVEGRVLERQEGLRHTDALIGLPDGHAVPRRDGAPLLEEDIGPLLARRVGRLAAALKPDAHDAAVLLRDGGHALAAFCAATPAQVTCIEPDAALVVLQPDVAWEPGQSARGGPPRLVVDDPRAWLLRHPHELDLVFGNLFRPDAPGAEGWLTLEQFLALRGALREGGVAVVALPLELLPWPAFERVGAAFLQAFPDARLFTASLLADVPIAVLAGGLAQGVPGSKALDELLAPRPSVAGLNGAPDVYDVYVCDGWTLAGRWRDLSPSTLAQPWGAWLSTGRASDAPLLARLGLRLLADLAVPLETSSLQARPIAEKDDRRLGAELTARSAALVGLLTARSAQLALTSAAPGEQSDAERTELDDRLDTALLFAWHSAPGHLDVRDALLERASRLTQDGRTDVAAKLLDQAVQVLRDPRLAGVLGGLLLKNGQTDTALTLLREARDKAPEDRSVLVNLAAALLLGGDDAAGRDELEDAARVSGGAPLPPVPAATLALLRGEVAAVAPARALLSELPPGDPWAVVLRRLLAVPPPGGPPPR